MEKARERRIKASKDYDMFTCLEYNREIVPSHVRRLEESIKQSNDLHLHPIIVTPSMEVVDGQHRLKAAQNLDTPIYYVTDENYTSSKIMLMNSNQKNWSIENFVDYWCHMGNDNYVRLKELKSQFDHLPYMVITDWLYNEPRGRVNDRIRQGKLKLEGERPGLMQLANAYHLITKLKERNYRPVKLFVHRAFHMALKKLFSSPLMDVERFYERFDAYPYDIKYSTTWYEYVDQLANMYNYKMKTNVLKVQKTQTKLELVV